MHKTSVLYIALSMIWVICFMHPHVYAAKKRIINNSKSPIFVAGSFSSAKLSRSTNSIIVTFLNTQRVKNISYVLSYTTHSNSQGVIGSLVPQTPTDSRDLYFGTCSKGVCTPHYDIKNATLTITTTLKTGETNIKRYSIRW